MATTTPADDRTLTGDRVVLRPATHDDATTIVGVLTDPDVARWWPNETLERVRAGIADDEEHGFVVEHDGTVIGFVQYWEESDPEYRHAGIEIALLPAWHGQGLGTDIVRTLVGFLLGPRAHHRVTIDPAASNARAIRCYEKVGFRPVGVMREYEQGADGTWHDGLLMDLLARDVT
jgi:aminoglycoside 6'-N-acetyltransferase